MEKQILELLAEMRASRDKALADGQVYLGILQDLAALLNGQPEATSGLSIGEALIAYVERLGAERDEARLKVSTIQEWRAEVQEDCDRGCRQNGVCAEPAATH